MLRPSAEDFDYLERMTAEPIATPRLSRLLARRARSGDAAARTQLVAQNTRIVFGVLRDHFEHVPHLSGGLEKTDLVQEGMIGLDAAARAYDPDNKASFGTFAYISVRRQMAKAVREKHQLVYRPQQVYNRQRAMAAASKAIAEREGRSATLEEIAEAASVELDEVVVWLDYPDRLISLDAPVFEEGAERYESTANVVNAAAVRHTAMCDDDVEILSARLLPKDRRPSVEGLAERFNVTKHEMARRLRAAERRSQLQPLPSEPDPEVAIGLMSLRPRDWEYLERFYLQGETAAAIAAEFHTHPSEVSRRVTGLLEDWSTVNPGRDVADARQEAQSLWRDNEEHLDALTGKAAEVARLTWREGLDRVEVAETLGISESSVSGLETGAMATIVTRLAMREGNTAYDVTPAAIRAHHAEQLKALGPTIDRGTLGLPQSSLRLAEAVRVEGRPVKTAGGAMGLSPAQAQTAYKNASKILDAWLAAHPGAEFADFVSARGATRATLAGLIEHLPQAPADAIRVREFEGGTWTLAAEAVGQSLDSAQKRYAQGLDQAERLVARGAERYLATPTQSTSGSLAA